MRSPEVSDVELKQAIPSEVIHDDAEQLVARMRALIPLVWASNWSHIGPFLEVYTEVTDNAEKAAKAGAFDEPATVRHTMPLFADEFFVPFRHAIDGQYNCMPLSWKIPMLDPRARVVNEATQFSIGMFTHIMYDLPEAVRKSNPRQTYKKDFISGIGIVLRDTAIDVAPILLPNARDPVRKVMTMVGTRGVAYIRDDAWDDFEKLKAAYAMNPALYNRLRARQDAKVAFRNRTMLLGSSGLTLAGAARQGESGHLRLRNGALLLDPRKTPEF